MRCHKALLSAPLSTLWQHKTTLNSIYVCYAFNVGFADELFLNTLFPFSYFLLRFHGLLDILHKDYLLRVLHLILLLKIQITVVSFWCPHLLLTCYLEVSCSDIVYQQQRCHLLLQKHQMAPVVRKRRRRRKGSPQNRKCFANSCVTLNARKDILTKCVIAFKEWCHLLYVAVG